MANIKHTSIDSKGKTKNTQQRPQKSIKSSIKQLTD